MEIPRDYGAPPDVESRLRALGSDPALARRSNSLGMLADALTGPDGHLWAKVNLFDAFGEESLTIRGEAATVNWLAWTELVRNFAILLPLLWTWAAIGFGIDAFNRLLATTDINEKDFVTAPFIQQWAKGFGNRTWITFKWVALIDVMLILLVIVMSFLVSFMRKKLDVSIEEERDRSWNNLREVLTLATVALAAKGYDAPARFSEELSLLWIKYQDVAFQMTNASRELEQALGISDAFTNSMHEASAGLLDAGQSFISTTKDLHGTVAGMRDDIKGLTVSADGLGSGVTQLIAANVDVGKELTSSIQSSNDAAASLKSSSQNMTVQVNETHDRFLDALRVEVAARDQATKQLADAGSNAQALAGGLKESAGQFFQAAEALKETASALPADITHAATQLAESVDQSRTSIDTIGQQLGQIDASYREVNAGFSTTSNKLDAVSTSIRKSSDVVSKAVDRSQGSTGDSSRLASLKGNGIWFLLGLNAVFYGWVWWTH